MKKKKFLKHFSLDESEATLRHSSRHQPPGRTELSLGKPLANELVAIAVWMQTVRHVRYISRPAAGNAMLCCRERK